MAVKDDKEFKIYNFPNKLNNIVEVNYTLMWDSAHRVYISSGSDDADYCGRGISYDKEVAIQAALDDYNTEATEEYQITRDRIVIE